MLLEQGMFGNYTQPRNVREEKGVIFFGEPRLDPRTKPWTSLVRSIVLPVELRCLAARNPGHPLVAAFQPLLAESESELEQKAGDSFTRSRRVN